MFIMRRKIEMKQQLILLLCLILLMPQTQVNATVSEPSDWAVNSVNHLMHSKEFRQSVFTNYQGNLTRKEFIYLAVRAYEVMMDTEVIVDDAISFVDTDDLYALKGATIGITDGIGDGKFGPEIIMPREQLAVFIHRLMELTGITLNEATEYTFVDDSDFSDWARMAIYSMKANEIIQGVGNDRFDAKGYGTVEQALVIIDRVIGFSGVSIDTELFKFTKENISIGDTSIFYFEPIPEEGIYWGGYIMVPDEIRSKNMLVINNNPHSRGDTYEEMKAFAIEGLQSNWTYAEAIGAITLIPVFPRYNDMRTDWAEDGSMYNLTQHTLLTDIPEYQDADIQLAKMIKGVWKNYHNQGLELEKRVAMVGYSATAIFESRFILLQSDLIKCAVTGGHGWNILPYDTYNGVTLNYPFGIADIGEEKAIERELNLESFYKIPLLSYMGSVDENRFGYSPGMFAGILPSFTIEGFHQVCSEEYAKFNENAEFYIVEGADHGSAPDMFYDHIINFLNEECAFLNNKHIT